MNIGEFVLRHGGNKIVSYKIDGDEVDETTYKTTMQFAC